MDLISTFLAVEVVAVQILAVAPAVFHHSCIQQSQLVQIGYHIVQSIACFVPRLQQSEHNHQVTNSVLCKLQVN
jgi:hypothetical protein